MSRITQVDIIPFTFEVDNLTTRSQPSTGIGNLRYEKGATLTVMRYAVAIRTDDGCEGRYVTHMVGSQGALGQTLMLAPHLLGRDPEHREFIYDDLKRFLRAYDHMGHGPLDIALWDLVGRKYNMSIGSMIGAYKQRLPAYASTHHGQEEPGGLDSVQAFADYAIECAELGFHGFKIHGWHNGEKRREAQVVLETRKAVGSRMDIMTDPASSLQTWNDALYVGRACDEIEALWYEDPYRDASVSANGQRLLREKLKTPLLVSEHVRGLESKATFILAGGADLIHTDPEYDLGITGTLKIAHLAEALGIDVQVHASGPAHRACVAAIRNTLYYELALVGPGMPNLIPPVYRCGYTDQVDAVGRDGCVSVPTGPGLGVDYDWEYINAHKIAEHTFRL